MPPWRKEADGLRLSVRLTPRADRDAIDGTRGLADDRVVLAARVRAVPEKGAANTALERLLAMRLGVPSSAVRVIAGTTQRLKEIRVEGDPDRLEAALVELLETS